MKAVTGCIRNTYELMTQPTPSDVLNKPGSDYFSPLFLATLREYLTQHDVLDAVREVEVMHAILKKRCDDEMASVERC